MNRFLSLALLSVLFLAGCPKNNPVPVPAPAPSPAPPDNKDFTINTTWKYDFTNFAACSGSVTTGCISGFSWGYINAANAQVPLKTSPASACSGTTQPETCADVTNSQLPMGSVNFYLVANFVNNSGAAASTAAVNPNAPLTITAGLPTAFTVSAQ